MVAISIPMFAKNLRKTPHVWCLNIVVKLVQQVTGQSYVDPLECECIVLTSDQKFVG